MLTNAPGQSVTGMKTSPSLLVVHALLLGGLIMGGFLMGCDAASESTTNSTDSDAAGRKRAIVTTTGMITDIVREVVGERAVVTGLIGEGVDPHLYVPTTSDIAALRDADLVFYNGLLLEGKMTDTLARLARSKPVYAVTEELDHETLIAPDGNKGHADPHVWMDVTLWAKAVEVVARVMAEQDPEHAGEFNANRDRYLAELEQLDAYVRQVTSSIPANQRVLITAHDAFNYFGRRYGLEVIGIQGISTESEAGVDDINRLVSLLVQQGVPAVFVESSVADKSVRALIEGASSRGHAVTIGGTLYSDAMGETGTYRGTYLGMLDHNATTITRALGGEAPSGGRSGKLDQE
jgi:manganese/zinc/iron transport system substrate-binding protein